MVTDQRTDQTVRPKWPKFCQYIPIMTWITAKKGFFEIQTPKGGRGPEICFRSFSSSLKSERISIWILAEKGEVLKYNKTYFIILLNLTLYGRLSHFGLYF